VAAEVLVIYCGFVIFKLCCPSGNFEISNLISDLKLSVRFSIIVVFTSIVGAEIYTENSGVKKVSKVEKSCLDCGLEEHEPDSKYCKQCGSRLWEL
jgi:voltage-gated potassium channel